MGKVWKWLLVLACCGGTFSCLVQEDSDVRKMRSSLDAGSTKSDAKKNEKDDFGPSVSDEPVYWFVADEPLLGILRVPPSLETPVSLRGTEIDAFLENQRTLGKDDAVYCLVFNFNNTGAINQYRARAVPINFNEVQENRREFILRVDLNLESSECNGNADALEGPTRETLRLDSICPGCRSITSSGVRLYSVDPTTSRISENTAMRGLDTALGRIGLRVEPHIAQEGAVGSCTDSSCLARGYDCCFQGQCVYDAQERADALAKALGEPNGFGLYYNEARQRVAHQPSLFTDYPDIYNICPQYVVPKEEAMSADQGSPIEEAIARFEEEKEEYFCLEGAKKEQKDYSRCGDRNEDGDIDAHDWDVVRKGVWRRCGCVIPSPEEPYCPDFGLKIREHPSTGEILSVGCDIPPPLQVPKPQQDIDIDISSRSVPHRFFRGDSGGPVDDVSQLFLTQGDIAAEGQSFFYLDEAGKTEPENGRFNMNAILGQMKVDLSGAHPAKVVPVEFGQNYVIMAKEGEYFPCPMCRKDSWFEGFSAHPPSYTGMGLQGVGSNTRRNIFDTNRTLGNYEDTLFGRACWVPPTMIPFTHKPSGNAVEQRRRRLNAQAALYVNGYQRDWYGFNKGALIGSFDGVQWFAVGTGRRVTATSGKLYLAINAPFGDLADPTVIKASVVVDLGGNESALVDFDPEKSLTDPYQNQGATCQYYHQCETDVDCVTQLGWEYMCADISPFKSAWPRFDSKALEKTNSQIADASFNDIIFGRDIVFNRQSKRCVYRGAGAICSRNLGGFSSDRERRMFSCAPNFYCEDVISTRYNDGLARTPDDILFFPYGQEGNVLGRPLDYVGAREGFSDEILENLRYNASSEVYITNNNFENNLGICRPGKNLSEGRSWRGHQRRSDTAGRTDYINQISSCNSDSFEDLSLNRSRVFSCPVFVMDAESEDYGNFAHFKEPDPFNVANPTSPESEPYKIKAYRSQNMCGNESQNDDGTSPFSFIESLALIYLKEQRIGNSEPTLVKDACLKRGGSPCFSDLDCTPNRLHGEQMDLLTSESFGGSLAEYEFWSQTLTCSQDKFGKEFKFNKNRCCRAVGQEFTMYSKIENATMDFMDYLGLSNDIIEQNPDVETLPWEGSRTSGYAGAASGEYSRYAVVDALKSTDTGFNGSGGQARLPVIDLSDGENTAAYQWKTFKETGEKTCCGGGWIRKFADGTHNWIDFKKLNINFENFSCLNHVSPLSQGRPTGVNELNWKQESDKLCLYPSDHGCIEQGIYKSEDWSIQAPVNFSMGFAGWEQMLNGEEDSNDRYGSLFGGMKGIYTACAGGGICGYVDTTPDDGSCSGEVNSKMYRNVLAPYLPIPLETQENADGDIQRGLCIPTPLLGNANQPVQMTLSLPVYIGGHQNIQGIQFKFFDQNGEGLGNCAGEDPLADCGGLVARASGGDLSGNATYECDDGKGYGAYGFADYFDDAAPNGYEVNDGGDGAPKFGSWCVHDDAQGRKVLKISFNKYLTFSGQNWAFASYRIEFNPIGTATWSGSAREGQSILPGNDLYYLSKLGRLELLGIPQIYHEPIYCSHNYDKLIPEIYHDDLYDTSGTGDDRNLVETHGQVFEYSTTRYGTGRALETMYDEGYSDTDHTKAVSGWTDGYAMYSSMINHSAIFSAHEFTCCRKLGQLTDDPTRCCSGFAVQREQQGDEEEDLRAYICKLPNGTNLNVYFNRFVSNEGTKEEDEEDGDGEPSDEGYWLDDEDFVPETGEIKWDDDIYDKLKWLGRQHCESEGTVKGGLVGNYTGSPNGGFTLEPGESVHSLEDKRYSFADDLMDYAEGSEEEGGAGAVFFQAGLHWNHHLYCAAGSSE